MTKEGTWVNDYHCHRADRASGFIQFGAGTARGRSGAVQPSPSLFLETDATILPVLVALPLILLLLLSHNTITS